MDGVEHLSKQELQLFLRGELDPARSRGIVRHLLTGCKACRELSAGRWQTEVLGAPKQSANAETFDRIFDRAAEFARSRGSAIHAERSEAGALLAELERHPTARARLFVVNSPRFQTWGLCESLLEAAFQTGFKEPQRAVELAEIALAVAETLPAERYGERLVKDLEARAWGTLGNARRIVSDLAEADTAIQRGLEIAEGGTGDPTEEARLLSFQATLRTAQRRYDVAIRLHDRILKIYSELGDRHMEGRTLGQKAHALRSSGDSEAAIPVSRQALRKLDPNRNSRDVLVVRSGLAHSLIHTDRLEDATEELHDLVREFAAQGNEIDSLRCEWQLGRVLLKRECSEEAEEQLRRTRDGFVEAEIPYDAALANLDLAQALFDQAKLGEMKQRLTESIPIFRSLGIHQETIAALLFLKRAIDLEQVTSGLIQATARFVEESRNDASLRFRAEALTGLG